LKLLSELTFLFCPLVFATTNLKVSKLFHTFQFLQESNMTSLEELKQSVIDGDEVSVEQGVQVALDGGTSPGDILNKALIPAMGKVGELFENQELFVPEMLVSARAMQAGLNILRPLLAETGVEPLGRVVLGTVKGDLHDIGKNLVGMMLEGGGFEVRDLGVDIDPEKFVAAARDGYDVVAMSALLTTTMANMQDVIDALEENDLRKDVKVVVGGAPVTEEFSKDIGADGYAEDASRAVGTVKELLGVEN
jgi:5-methyltetrahydrofolate--homocysteine methyltransferase